MAVSIAPGDVFHLPFPRPDFGHVHVVITSVNQHTGAFLCVPIDTWINAKLSDSTVILSVGDHTFISKKSFMNYEEAKILNIDILERLMACGDAKKMDPINSTLLIKIQHGVKKSDHSKKGIIEFYEFGS